MTNKENSRNIDSPSLNFLYKNTSLKRATVTRLIQSVVFSERLSSLKSQNITIDDPLVYKELTALIFPIMNEMSKFDSLPSFRDDYTERYGQVAYTTMWADYKLLKTATRESSEIVFGDRDHWLIDYKEFYGRDFVQPTAQSQSFNISSENNDMMYLVDICKGIPMKSLSILCSDNDFVDTLRNHGKVTSTSELFEVLKIVFYTSIRQGLKNHIDTKKIYFNRRRVITDLCKAIYDDEQYWHNDYDKWING